MPVAYAQTNIALVKYWGKRDDDGRGLNLPAVGSLSLTLDGFGTETRVERGGEKDTFVLGGQEIHGTDATRVFAFIDLVREMAGTKDRVTVTSRNDVPTAAGLASSASGFAALALAATTAFGVNVDARALSALARRGSGSAARSIFGGFVLMHKGERDDGSDAVAEPLASKLDVRLVVVRCADGRKDTTSRSGMGHAQRTSPFFREWIATHAADLDVARGALESADLAALGEVMEHSTFKMHSTTMTSRPPFFYWTPTTFSVLSEVRALRANGVGAWATMDAGPHVKVLCAPADAERVSAGMRVVEGVRGVDICAPGPAARITA
jgi:diphosphomevalonate decarboxylase